MTRLSAVAELERPQDSEYREGLRVAAVAAIEYLIASIELGVDSALPVPAAALVQARRAARYAVSLDTVLRRCFAGYTLFGDFLLREAQRVEPLGGAALNRILRSQAAAFDRLVAAVTDEYGRETGAEPTTKAEWHAKRIERLLAGELADTSELAYDLGAQHLGMIATGTGAVSAFRHLLTVLDRQLLLVERPDDETVWGWLGGRKDLDAETLRASLSSAWPEDVSLAVGGSGAGIAGWRRTHQQARAAVPVALTRPGSATHYTDVVLLASTLKDELLAETLTDVYLRPLEDERDGGEALRQTLRAYFTADHNVSSAAAALGVNRHTVASRLRAAELIVGRPLAACAAEFECALELHAYTCLTA